MTGCGSHKYAAAQEGGSGLIRDYLSGVCRAMSLLEAIVSIPSREESVTHPWSLNG